MSAERPTVIRLSSIEGVAAAVPHLLGFAPSESIVAMTLSGSRINFTMRMDLPPAPLYPSVVTEIAKRVRTAGADGVMIVVFTDEPLDMAYADLVTELIVALDGIKVRDAVLVGQSRVWSYLCDNPACCPPEGRPIGGADADALAAAHALNGRGVAPSREAAQQWIAAPVADDVRLAYATAQPHLPDLDRFDDPRTTLSVDEVASAVRALDDVGVRDALLSSRRDEVRGLLRHLASRTPTGLDAGVCTSLALLEYLKGDGMIAASLLERAMATDPDYALAALLAMALDAQVPPSALRDLLSL